MSSLPETVDQLFSILQSDSSSWISVADTFDRSSFEFLGVNLDELVKTLVDRAGSVETLKQDMMILILVTQFRGVNLTKIASRMKAGGKSRFDGIVSKYGIVPHKRELPASKPTIPRILSLFPQIILGVRQGYPHIVGRPLGAVPSGLPEALCFPGGCAMIKTSNQALLTKWVEWYSSFCSVVKMNPVPTVDQMTIAHRLSKVDESDRA